MLESYWAPLVLLDRKNAGLRPNLDHVLIPQLNSTRHLVGRLTVFVVIETSNAHGSLVGENVGRIARGRGVALDKPLVEPKTNDSSRFATQNCSYSGTIDVTAVV